MPDHPDRLESLFAAATELPPDARPAFLEKHCAGEPELQKQLEALLRAHDRTHHPLDAPADPELAGTHLGSQHAAGEQIAGRYKLLEAIGEGGMGTVWVAEQWEPVRRKVAIKVIKPGMDSRAVLARFEAERQALAMMDHPNIAKVLDGGLTEAGRPYFVMEYVKGVPITEYCDQAKLSVAERLELLIQVCSAVQHAHHKGIIHRDLKPSNILVAPYDDRLVPKVIDFGLAKALHQRLTDRTLHTAHETVIGTPLYMSPEQAQLNNLDVDTRSDIYSLGVLLYELLTGTTPLERRRFQEAAWEEIRRIIREEEPPRPSTRLSSIETLPSLAATRQSEPIKLTAQLRGELDWIAMKALEKDRTRRYGTVTDLAKDVERFLTGENVEACPPTVGYRVQKFVRRHRTQVLVASLLFTALLLGILGTTVSYLRAERARKIAVENQQQATAASEQAIEQRERAESVIQRTMQLLDNVTSDALGDSVLSQQSLTPEQQQFYSDALSYYRDLSAQHGNRGNRERFAEAAMRVGQLNVKLGKFEEAIAGLEEASQQFASLAQEFTDSPDYRQSWARSLSLQGHCWGALGNRDRAEALGTQVLEMQRALTQEFPGNAKYQLGLVRSYNLVGGNLAHRDRFDEAFQFANQAIAITQQLVNKYPQEPQYLNMLATFQYNQGAANSRLRRFAKAQDWNQRAIESLRALVTVEPMDPVDRAFFAHCLAWGTDYALELGRAEEESVQEAIGMLKELTTEFPNVPKFGVEFAQAHRILAKLQWRQRQDTLALQSAHVAHDTLREWHSRSERVARYLGDVCRLIGTMVRDQDRVEGDLTASLEWLHRATQLHKESYGQEVTPWSQRSLGSTLIERAKTRELLGKHGGAISDWQRVASVCPDLKPTAEAGLVTAQLQRGTLDLEQARARVAEVDLPADNLSLARFFAVAAKLHPAQREELESASVRAFEKAASSAASVGSATRDRDFAALRSHPEFQTLQQRWQEPFQVSANASPQDDESP